MLRLDAGDALGQTLNAFDQRRTRLHRATRRDGGAGMGFARGAFGPGRTFGAFCARGLLCWIGCDAFGRGCCWRGGGLDGRGSGGVLGVSSGCVFTGARREGFAPSTTATATASASAGAVCGLVACGFCAARNGLFTVRHSGVRLL